MARRRTRWIDGSVVLRTGRRAVPYDAYHSLMEASWLVFSTRAALVFVIFNLIFALSYLALPGSVANMRTGSLADAFFFSAATLSTVGYGNMYPASTLGNGVAAIEMFVGLFFSAALTGLIFARFSRPREMLLSSRVATLSRERDAVRITVRLIPLRNHAIIDAVAKLYRVERRPAGDGRTVRRLVDLPLDEPEVAIVPLSWTLTHSATLDSALVRDHDRAQLELVLRVDASYPLLASAVTASRVYRQPDIREGHRFVEILTEQAGMSILDVGGIDATLPAGE